jgi:drug/metabolite transporter (DMT)-like permease
MPSSNSNPTAIGFIMSGVLVLVVALVIHLLTENPTGLYFVSLGFLVIGVLLNLVDDK